MRKKLLLFALLIFCVNIAYAAELKGTIYNSELELQKDAIVEINTEPRQSIVSKDGAYAFNVPEGSYLLSARLMSGNDIELFADENVSVPADGSYTLDIILFDVLEADEPLEELDITSGLEGNGTAWYLGILFLILLLIAVVLALRFVKKNAVKMQEHVKEELALNEKSAGSEKNISSDLEKIISIIKSEGGRTTQLEIRKHFPLSEAKISLMIAELEDKGIVRKIKKGRGNILILASGR